MLTVTMGESNKALYSKMIVDVVIGPVLERVRQISHRSETSIKGKRHEIEGLHTRRTFFIRCIIM